MDCAIVRGNFAARQMALREKFGRLVLLEETDSGPLGSEYRAARLGPSGFDRLVSVLRFSPSVSAHAEASKRLVEEARLAAQAHGPGLVRVLGVGRVGPTFYLSTELVEGRTLRNVLSGCREGGFPFAADHALMIASRAAAALELLHARKDDGGRALMHGFVSPRQLAVAFDGEVKLKGLGLWSALAGTDLVGPEERAWLAPEQATGRGDARSDVYALGLVLLEALAGPGEAGVQPLQRVAAARIAGQAGEHGPLPRPLVDLLNRALAPEPASRFPAVSELRRAIDALLFSGDFTPTTFDLAFFMHTLFRDEVDRDARAIEEARAADYGEFVSDEPARAATAARTEPVDPRSPAPDETDALAAHPTLVPPPTEPQPQRPPAPAARADKGPDSSQARLAARTREAGAREAASRLSLGGVGARRAAPSRSLVLVIGVIGAVGLGGGAGWLYFVAQRRAARAAQASAEQVAADARVRELEARIAQLEREKAEAEARAAEEARTSLEQAAAAGGRPADPAAIARAQEEARGRAREEQERRQRQELERLAAERQAEQQRLAAAQATAPSPTPTPAPTPTPLPAPPTPTPTPALAAAAAATATATAPAPPGGPPAPASTPAGPGLGLATATEGVPVPTPPAASPAAAAAVRPGDLVEFNDPALRPPVILTQARVQYPPIALAARIEGIVELRALVDAQGSVSEVTIVRCTRPGARFEEAAERHVRSRKYRAATKDGVPVRVWLPIVVNFKVTR